jgi:excisionase family DNA binding protein
MSAPIPLNRGPRFDSPVAPRGLTRADLLTAADVADLLGVPVSTVREWGRNGTLPRIKLGRHVRFLRVQVEAAIFAAQQSPTAPPRDGKSCPVGGS